MSTDQLIKLCVTLTLIVMMIGQGLAISWTELVETARNWRLSLATLVANYVCVPAAAVVLLWLFQPSPEAAAGFLILAACPGAPYGPPLTVLAKGNQSVAVGLMVLLAASSAVLAPLCLQMVLPLFSAGTSSRLDSFQLIRLLLISQLIPLAAGAVLRLLKPTLADRLLRPFRRGSALLNAITIGLIVTTQFPVLLAIRPRGYLGMGLLLFTSLASGWILGRAGRSSPRTLAITTALRNIGVGLVIAAEGFPGTSAVTAVLAYGLFGLVGTLVVAMFWGRSRMGLREPRDADLNLTIAK